MNSSQLTPTEQWRNLLGIFATVADEQGPRLESEASWFGRTVEGALVMLLRLDPEKAWTLFQEENPDLNLNKLDLNEPYSVAVALMQLLG